MAEQVKVQTNDGQVFTVLCDEVKGCKTINDLVEDIGPDHVVPLPGVSGSEFVKVMEWRRHCTENPQPARPEDVSPLKKKFEPTEWELNFVKDLTNDQLNRLVMAANYVGDKELLDFFLNVIAYTKVLGKTPEEIAAFFNIQTPLTDEELRAVEDDPELAFLKEDP